MNETVTTNDELRGLGQQVTDLFTLHEMLQNSAEHNAVLIDRLMNISADAGRLAISTAISAIDDGEISRRGAADLLGMHSHTLQRMMDERNNLPD